MSHELRESPENIELSVSAPTREELFRDALAGVLEAACGASLAEETYEGRVVPVQASGGDDETLLAELVEDTLRAVREEPGTLRPPRWLAFDEKRVTATLPLHSPKVPVRALEVGNAAVDSSAEGWTARLELLPIPAA